MGEFAAFPTTTTNQRCQCYVLNAQLCSSSEVDIGGCPMWEMKDSFVAFCCWFMSAAACWHHIVQNWDWSWGVARMAAVGSLLRSTNNRYVTSTNALGGIIYFFANPLSLYFTLQPGISNVQKWSWACDAKQGWQTGLFSWRPVVVSFKKKKKRYSQPNGPLAHMI